MRGRRLSMLDWGGGCLYSFSQALLWDDAGSIMDGSQGMSRIMLAARRVQITLFDTFNYLTINSVYLFWSFVGPFNISMTFAVTSPGLRSSQVQILSFIACENLPIQHNHHLFSRIRISRFRRLVSIIIPLLIQHSLTAHYSVQPDLM